MLSNCLFVGCGGFIGSVLRYLLSYFRFESVPLPLVTLGINVLGSYAIMFFSGYFAASAGLDSRWVLFLRVGLCGGFTTFSTFSVEMLGLIEQGEIAMAVLYAALSCMLCVVAAFLGETASASIAPASS